jgi:hypothetical protein
MLDMIVDDVLPNALLIGVDYDLFWTLNPKSLQPFHRAFILKQKYDDTVSWQLGNYIRIAIASSFNKSAKYPDRPATSMSSGEATMEEIKERFLRKAKMINKSFGKEGL